MTFENKQSLIKQFEKYDLLIADTHLDVMKKFCFTINPTETDQQKIFLEAQEVCDEITSYFKENFVTPSIKSKSLNPISKPAF